MNPWFRFYHEALDDPKVQRLPAELFRAWVNMLCVACRNDGELPGPDDLAFAMRIPEDEIDDTLDALVAFGLLDETENGFAPHGWAERQFKSDNSTDRVKRFREKDQKRSAKRRRNVSVTPDETPPEQSRTDTDSEQKEGGAAAPQPAPWYAKKGKAFRVPEGEPLPDDWRAWAAKDRPDLDLNAQWARYGDWSRSSPKGAKLDHFAGWRNWIRGCDPPKNGIVHDPTAERKPMSPEESIELDLRTKAGPLWVGPTRLVNATDSVVTLRPMTPTTRELLLSNVPGLSKAWGKEVRVQ